MVANVAVTEFTTSAVAVWLVQKLKSASWFPWLEAGKAWASRIASLFLAAVGAVGVSYTWAPNPNGGHFLTIAIPTFTAIMTAIMLGAWQWLNHFVLQETIYQATVNKPSITTDRAGAIPAMVSPAGAVVVPKPTGGVA